MRIIYNNINYKVGGYDDNIDEDLDEDDDDDGFDD